MVPTQSAVEAEIDVFLYHTEPNIYFVCFFYSGHISDLYGECFLEDQHWNLKPVFVVHGFQTPFIIIITVSIWILLEDVPSCSAMPSGLSRVN